MSTNSTNIQPFHLGIVMAGAISAGAYTGGVMDYLIEALGRWESERQKGNVPTHKVKLDVLCGTSAGGMTAGMTARALMEEIPHLTPDKRNNRSDQQENMLYNSWVNLTDNDAGNDMLRQIMDTKDLNSGLRSALNAQFLEKIADRVVNRPLPPVKYARPYVADEMHLIMTQTNVVGLPCSASFSGAGSSTNKHTMRKHADMVHFKYNGIYSSDGRIPLDLNDKDTKLLYRQATIGTGAFPVGLPARQLIRKKQQIVDHDFLNPNGKGKPLAIADPYHSLSVDGGVMNNEPFDIAKKYLTNTGSDNNAMSTTIMVDPFPDMWDNGQVGKEKADDRLLAVIMQLLGAMVNQMRFKPENVDGAWNENDLSKFIISPVRDYGHKTKKLENQIEGPKAIACGSLGGFGGFVDKSFRHHDYMLGRRNCQRFLQKYFVVPLVVDGNDHPYFRESYADIDVLNRFGYKEQVGDKQIWYVPIIPDTNLLGFDPVGNPQMKDRTEEKPIENGFPKYSGNIHEFKPQVKDRIGELIRKLVCEFNLPWIFNVAVAAKSVLANKAIETVEEQLVEHGL